MLQPFVLEEPTSVRQASAILARYGEAARLYAGGTELLLVMKEGLLHYERLINLKTIPGLASVTLEAGTLRIGATTTHRRYAGLWCVHGIARWSPGECVHRAGPDRRRGTRPATGLGTARSARVWHEPVRSGHQLLEIAAEHLHIHIDHLALRDAAVETPDGRYPYADIIERAPAIANALARAIGVRLKELSLTPERVRVALAGVEATVRRDVP